MDVQLSFVIDVGVLSRNFEENMAYIVKAKYADNKLPDKPYLSVRINQQRKQL